MPGNDNKLLADVSNSCLILIDAQIRLTQVMSDRKTLLRNCETLLTAANILSVPVAITEQYPKGLGHTEPSLADAFPDNAKPVEKTCFSCCSAENFATSLSTTGKQQLILCGIESHVCVLQTAMDLLDRDYQVFVVADAVDSRSKDNKRIALERMQQAGVIVTTTESVLFEWLKDAKHEHFRAVTALIR
ncbi:hydrolase [Kaarinaea lacus]